MKEGNTATTNRDILTPFTFVLNMKESDRIVAGTRRSQQEKEKRLLFPL